MGMNFGKSRHTQEHRDVGLSGIYGNHLDGRHLLLGSLDDEPPYGQTGCPVEYDYKTD